MLPAERKQLLRQFRGTPSCGPDLLHAAPVGLVVFELS
jgi:hypothetical protein